MKNSWKLLTIVLVIAALVGCQQAEPTPAASADTDTSAVVSSTGGQGDLDDVNRLALGTVNLEGTADAVTAAQAAELLPLWQVIQSGMLKSAAETEAVTKQIEGKMTASQLAAIEVMSLTSEDTQAWMQEQGIEMPARPEGQGGSGAPEDLSEDERAAMRKELQTPGGVTDEERATRIAEMGIERPEGGGGARPSGADGGTRQSNPILGPLVELLTARATG